MQRRFSLLFASWLLLLAACGDNPNDPMQEVAGSYTATTLSATRGSTTFNLLEAGALHQPSIALELRGRDDLSHSPASSSNNSSTFA
jgi:hypothetical protein